jgi:DNA-binding transcriptional MerR regulator
LGFTLDQVRDLLRLSTQENQPCTEVNRISAEHLTAIEQKIADLTRLADELRRINGRCQCRGLIADCRIIEALSP